MTPDTPNDTTDATEAPEASGGPFYVVSITDAHRLTGASVRTIQRRLDSGEYQAVDRAGKRWVKLPASEIITDISDEDLAGLAIEADATAGTVTHDATGDTLNASHSTLARVTTGDRGRDSAAFMAALVTASAQAAAQAAGDVIAHQQASRGASVASVADLAAKTWLTIEEASALTGIGKTAIERAIKAGALTARSGLGQGRRLKREAVQAWADSL